MRLGVNLLIVAVAIAVGVGVYLATDGRFAFFFLPLLIGLPFLRRR